jgi:glycosyl transferase family 25
MFPTITCISLADQHERRAFMKAQLDSCGMPYHFMDAVRVDLTIGYPASYDQKRRLNHSCTDMRAGEMGCYLSHRQAWQEFLDSGEEISLIVEDDVELRTDFIKTIMALCERKDLWDFVRLFGIFKRPTYKSHNIYGSHYLVDYLKQPNGTQGYLMNRAAAERLMKHTASMIYPIDVAIDRDWEHGLRMMGIEPSIVSHPEVFETTLGDGQGGKLALHKKISREFYRAGPSIKKQIWMLKKRLQYL